MKKLFSMIIYITMMFICFSCEKENNNMRTTPPATQSGDVIFWSDDLVNRWSITLDGVDRGSVAQSSTEPNCGNLFFHNFELSAGTHTLQVKSMSGLADQPQQTITIYANDCNKFNIR